jgi:hypothetical protein
MVTNTIFYDKDNQDKLIQWNSGNLGDVTKHESSLAPISQNWYSKQPGGLISFAPILGAHHRNCNNWMAEEKTDKI